MGIVRYHLDISRRYLQVATSNLQDALRIAKLRELPPNYIDAINKALTDNLSTSRHVGNIATCIIPHDKANPLTPAEPMVP